MGDLTTGVTVIIPTFNGGQMFENSLQVLLHQEYTGVVQIVIIDSGSSDSTVQYAQSMGVEVVSIPHETFNHSKTRNLALNYAKFENVVYLVQDAVPTSSTWLSELDEALNSNEVIAVYGRQIPHADADAYARFEVDYYNGYLGDDDSIQSLPVDRSLDSFDYDTALRMIRFDNVCAIYKRGILERHPFPDVVYGEDLAWAKEVITKGYTIMYSSKISVSHSHNRSPQYRLCRAAVEAVVCAQVLSRVRDDLSFVTVTDLLAMASATKRIRRNPSQTVSRKAHVRNPGIRKLVVAFLRRFRFRASHSAFVLAYKSTITNHMNHVVSLIRDKFPNTCTDDLIYSADQAAASGHGRFIGEVYASYLLKGNVPRDLEEYVQPFLLGV